MSKNSFVAEFSSRNYSSQKTMQKPTVKSLVLKILKRQNARIEELNKRYGEEKFKTIEPYRFLDNISVCKLLEIELLRKSYATELTTENENEIAYILDYDLYGKNYPTSFESDHIIINDVLSCCDAWYEFTSKSDEGKEEDIVVLSHSSGDSGWMDREQLFFNRDGLQTKTIHEFRGKAYKFERNKNNTEKIIVTYYPNGINETDPEDLHPFEIKIKELSEVTSNSPDPLSEMTSSDPLMIPSSLSLRYVYKLYEQSNKLIKRTDGLER